MIDYTMIAAVITTVLALIMTGLGLRYREQYRAAMLVIEHSAMFVGGVSEVLAVATKALEDDNVTQEEVQAIVARLEKVLSYLKELESLLGR